MTRPPSPPLWPARLTIAWLACVLGVGALALFGLLFGKAPARRTRAGPRGDRCFHAAAYQALARQPAGLVLSEIDLGPFVLAYTPSSAMAAPYHRMSTGMLTARGVLSSEAEAAQAEARRLGFRYVLECPGHARNADRTGMKADSLQKRLDRNAPPSWLEPIPTNGTLRLYRVRPAA